MAASLNSANSTSTSSLALPHVKLLSYHLQTASEMQKHNGRMRWMSLYNGKQILFSIAWVQGTIINVDIEKEEVLIKDDSGKVKLTETKMNRATIEDLYVLQQGNYVMAIGDLLENKDVPTLLTRKLKLLEKNKIELASLWPLEVQHQLKYAPLSQQ